MLKEDRDNSMRLFKEEKDSMQTHIDLIEKEKQQLAGVYKKKSDDMQKEFDMETERLRQLQRDTIEKLKQDHDDALKRVKYMKDTEIDAAMAATSHSRTIESVLNLIEDNTKNLDGLSEKVKMGHMINLNEHEVQIRNKEEYLKSK
jgi:Fas-binding factor 1